MRGVYGGEKPSEGHRRMTDTYELRVRTFRMGTEHDVVAKILEEASEAHMAWRVYRDSAEDMSHVVDELTLLDLADELADCITACCNLAARYGIDMQAAVERVEQKNRERGRY